MARHDPTELAKAAYAAYGGATGGKNHRGEPMPMWDKLGATIQTAWEVAAEAVAREVLGLNKPGR
ncbi:hypothetical protein LXH13_06070 [Streptomyces spinosirectus]|jgi:hypothetical protein|uniref:hypothetical protein n=1 Tax=Streptomyces TaxID=1883 RepID=UPI000FFF0826|nr:MULTISPECIES: hypothetical protein [Streptomyces]MBY8342029.1 hypothetical protein [Streptomyces plumbidurans]UIR16624.1 hypothetical protein LXH13_06070 [Streptomyces spinosirectus]